MLGRASSVFEAFCLLPLRGLFQSTCMVFSLVARLVVRKRFWWLAGMSLFAVLVGYTATRMQANYKLSNILPEDSPIVRAHEDCRRDFKTFTHPLVLGITDRRAFRLDKFRAIRSGMEAMEKLDGVESVLSFTNPPQPIKDKENKKIVFAPLFEPVPTSQHQLDSLKNVFFAMPVYSGQLYNATTGAVLSVLNLDPAVFFSEAGGERMEEIFSIVDKMEKETGIEVNYSGLSYFRYLSRASVKREIAYFVLILFLTSTCLLLLVFRSFYKIIPALLLLFLGIPTTISLMVWLGYKASMLSTLVIPITIVVCVTNYVYFANYYQNARRHFGKIPAIVSASRRVTPMLFFANFTTAIGFLVLSTIDNAIVRQFGVVTGLGIMSSFVLSIVALPLFLSLIPFPSASGRVRELSPFVQGLLSGLRQLLACHHKKIIGGTLVVVLLSLWGLFHVQPISYLGDYLGIDKKAEKSLHFVQDNFGGLLPLELVVDTQKKGGVYALKNIKKLEAIQDHLRTQPYFSSSLSFVDLFKAGTQAFYNGDSAFYKIPSRSNFPFVYRYLSRTEEEGLRGQGTYVDEEGRKYRVAVRVKDMGSHALSQALDRAQTEIDALLQDTPMRATFTGTATLLIGQNDYLVGSFTRSMLLAFLVVAISISILLKRATFVYISVLTNLIPLFIVIGIIGGVGLKVIPSTIFTLTISFGISIDNSIHFLSHYNTERGVFGNTWKALTCTIARVGPNMVRSAVILFFSFVFFVFSSFDSIANFGVLVSFTLIFTLLSNLIFLPALLIVTTPALRASMKAS